MAKIQIQQDSKILDVHISSVNSRYVNFVIRNDLSLEMQVPIGMSWEMITYYVRLNERRIFEEYERKKARNHQALPITLDLEEGRLVYRSGLRLPLLGKMDLVLRVKYVPDCEETKIYIEDGPGEDRFLVVRTDNNDQNFLRYCVMTYYKRYTQILLRGKTARLARQMNLCYNTVSITGKFRSLPVKHRPRLAYQNIEIKNQLTLWGSCTRKRDLHFDWKLAMLPPEIVDYIIVHELTHLEVMNHSKRFWKKVEAVMPEYRECQRWLTKHGREYEIF